MNFSSGDWYYEHVYYSMLKRSLQMGQIPYHLSVPPDHRGSDRFLGLPNVLLSPQFVLLKWLPIPVFTLVNVLLLYSIGYLGCLSIRRRYQLTLGPFAFLFLLFNFNGFITAHLGAGHADFLGYFLLSWYVLLVLQMIENPNCYVTTVAFPLVLAGIAYQGSFHIYVWCCAFLLAVGLCNPVYLRQVSLALFLSAVACSCRLLPAMIALHGFKDFFHPGYADIRELIDAMTLMRDPTYSDFPPQGTPNTWAGIDMYIGVAGFLIISYFGIYLRVQGVCRQDQEDKEQDYQGHQGLDYRDLDLPLVGFTLMSFGYLQFLIYSLPLPFAGSQREPSRFFILPLVVLITIASIRLNQLLPSLLTTLKRKILAVLTLLQIALTLGYHSLMWRLGRLEMGVNPPQVPTNLQIVHRYDPLYVNVVNITVVLSATTLVILTLLTAYYSKRDRKLGNLAA